MHDTAHDVSVGKQCGHILRDAAPFAGRPVRGQGRVEELLQVGPRGEWQSLAVPIKVDRRLSPILLLWLRPLLLALLLGFSLPPVNTTYHIRTRNGTAA